MAQIVFGAGVSHSPLFTLAAEDWCKRGDADRSNSELNLSDGRRLNYQQLHAEVGDRYGHLCDLKTFERQADICQKALDRTADALEAASPDIVIIVGDDQEELFNSANQPTIAIFYGSKIVTIDKFGGMEAPDWMQKMARGYLMDECRSWPGAPEFGLDLIQGLLDRDVDIAVADRVENPEKAGFGHAFGFVINRLFKGRNYPVLPVLLNTYYPPNVPTARRTYDLGRALRGSIESRASTEKVAIIASGGLSHFVVDEDLDRSLLDGLQNKRSDVLTSLPSEALKSGSSEILNWVLAAGALEEFNLSWSEYQPIYRTPAGTGLGAAFVVWESGC